MSNRQASSRLGRRRFDRAVSQQFLSDVLIAWPLTTPVGDPLGNCKRNHRVYLPETRPLRNKPCKGHTIRGGFAMAAAKMTKRICRSLWSQSLPVTCIAKFSARPWEDSALL
jgi:hypothetical protein